MGSVQERGGWSARYWRYSSLGRFAVKPNRGGGARSRACLKRTTWLSFC